MREYSCQAVAIPRFFYEREGVFVRCICLSKFSLIEISVSNTEVYFCLFIAIPRFFCDGQSPLQISPCQLWLPEQGVQITKKVKRHSHIMLICMACFLD